ncbi:MAG: phosphatidylserine/phosphatidylglycerophosphate/cardiolipin synthase family protein [Bacteroidales bacterium]|nr:phosphatidylserine/phosphatidylglycerophosphate/cardiolipin synthase family protein [Bacteroidales bacterium]MCF8344485.1 phosphatidylserine/phosphatidylglycerophosphate/cardiolipin synthase family protein [Bacteroidales bacterium]MCF8352079.1 phosphatidylserine/phosphatidylglycerophosphate/cardiolipin synthase family protein [Bacteroidales bacterium]MCF8377343.1 phosphatidylserine/phosphatidylglycerophosphate/cardiolipin synthase family protein [Bacteroidales bacterium]MCF8401911.1 phosphat
MEAGHGQYKLFEDTFSFYNAMLEDFERAEKYIYIEMYRMLQDSIGMKVRNLLARKAKEGLEVKILLDSWGAAPISYGFFRDVILHGGELRFFEKIKINFDFFTRSHRRNHRKIIVIDDKISYIGSSNITDYNIDWKELILRIEGDLAFSFRRVFLQDFRIYNKYVFDKVRYSRPIKYENLELIRDVPSITLKRINKRFLQLIKKANKQIYIETPYFIPGFLLRKALSEAAKRGVNVVVIIPRHSDVGLVDILRNKYLGPMSKNGVNFRYYTPNNLHAKAMLIDDKIFCIGSANFDYRSFRYMYEIVLLGEEPLVSIQLHDHITETLKSCKEFDYSKWERRPLINKLFEWLLLPVRHLL